MSEREDERLYNLDLGGGVLLDLGVSHLVDGILTISNFSHST